MHAIRSSVDNLFFFWAGNPSGRTDQMSAAIHSTCALNPGARAYLFTNDLSERELHPQVSRTCPLSIIRWTPEELTEDTPFRQRARELYPESIRKRHGREGNIWMMFSDLFRYLVLWRWGGTYLDLDDIAVRPMTRTVNVVPSSIPQAQEGEPGYGSLVRDRSTPEERYLRLGNDPLIRMEPGHPFLEKCLERALFLPPGLTGSRAMTDVYDAWDGTLSVLVRPCIDVLLHPGHGLPGYVSRQCGWNGNWWWEELGQDELQERYTRLRRLGTFAFVKNHGWKHSPPGDRRRALCEWIYRAAVDAIAAPEGPDAPDAVEGITVVIPTHRPRFLSDTLDALSLQTRRDFDVIVVENGERQPGTQALVDSYGGSMRIRYVFEKRLGLNVARNTGCRLARSAVVALLDDDCVPAGNWVEAIGESYARRPDAPLVAGRVMLRFRGVKPEWVAGDFRSLLSETDVEGPRCLNGTAQGLVGANFSFRRDVFLAAGGFDEEIGMIGKSPPQLCNDEMEFLRRVRSLTGEDFQLDPAIAVEHQVPADRLDVSFFEHRKYGQGVSDVALILDRGRRPLADALAKLERHLYDTGWLDRLVAESRVIGGEDRGVFIDNSIRMRVEYINGLAAACLERLPDRENISGRIDRYQHRGGDLAKVWMGQERKASVVLTRLAQLMLASAARKPARHQRCTAPATMLGRAAFFQAVKHALVSAPAGTIH